MITSFSDLECLERMRAPLLREDMLDTKVEVFRALCDKLPNNPTSASDENLQAVAAELMAAHQRPYSDWSSIELVRALICQEFRRRARANYRVRHLFVPRALCQAFLEMGFGRLRTRLLDLAPGDLFRIHLPTGAVPDADFDGAHEAILFAQADKGGALGYGVSLHRDGRYSAHLEEDPILDRLCSTYVEGLGVSDWRDLPIAEWADEPSSEPWLRVAVHAMLYFASAHGDVQRRVAPRTIQVPPTPSVDLLDAKSSGEHFMLGPDVSELEADLKAPRASWIHVVAAPPAPSESSA